MKVTVKLQSCLNTKMSLKGPGTGMLGVDRQHGQESPSSLEQIGLLRWTCRVDVSLNRTTALFTLVSCHAADAQNGGERRHYLSIKHNVKFGKPSSTIVTWFKSLS